MAEDKKKKEVYVICDDLRASRPLMDALRENHFDTTPMSQSSNNARDEQANRLKQYSTIILVYPSLTHFAPDRRKDEQIEGFDAATTLLKQLRSKAKDVPILVMYGQPKEDASIKAMKQKLNGQNIHFASIGGKEIAKLPALVNKVITSEQQLG